MALGHTASNRHKHLSSWVWCLLSTLPRCSDIEARDSASLPTQRLTPTILATRSAKDYFCKSGIPRDQANSVRAEKTLGSIISEAAVKYGVDPDLIAAVIWQESRGWPYAYRYEHGFFSKYIDGKSTERLGGHWPRRITEKSERRARAMSWGLMQVMGQTARELGYSKDELTCLVDPQDSVDLGTKLLAKKISEAKTTAQALQAYNGGANPNYATEVLMFLNSGAADRLFTQMV